TPNRRVHIHPVASIPPRPVGGIVRVRTVDGPAPGGSESGWEGNALDGGYNVWNTWWLGWRATPFASVARGRRGVGRWPRFGRFGAYDTTRGASAGCARSSGRRRTSRPTTGRWP